MTSPSRTTPKATSTAYFVDKGSGSDRCLSSIGTIFRKLKRDNDPDGGQTPICKKKLFGGETVKGRNECGNDCGNEGENDVIAKMTLSASILNSFATAGDEDGNEGGNDAIAKMTLSASILNSFATAGDEAGNEGFTECSTGTLVLNESFYNEFSTRTLQLDEEFDVVESIGSSSTAVIKD